MAFFSRRGSASTEPRCLLPVSIHSADRLNSVGSSRGRGGFCVGWFLSFLLAGVFLQGCVNGTAQSSAKRPSTASSPSPALKGTNAPRLNPAKPAAAATRGRRVTDPLAAESEAVIERRAAAHAAFAAAMIRQDEDGTGGALELFRKSLQNDPANLTLAIDLARRLLERKERDAALEILKRSAPRAVGSDQAATIQTLLGVTYAQLGRREEAMTAYREAIRLGPDELVNYQALVDLQAVTGRRTQILGTLEQAAAVKASEPIYWIELAELFRLHGKRDTNAAPRTLIAARRALEKAAALKPEDPGVMQRLGERYEAVGLPDKAESVYLSLKTRFPKDSRPTGKLAELYLRIGKNKEAGEQLEALKRENPSNPVPFYYLGLLAFEARDFPRASSHFERALLLNPEFEPIYADFAAARLSEDKPTEALTILSRAAGKFAPEFRREYLAGLAHARLQHFEDSLARFLAAEKAATPKHPELLDHRFYFQIGAMLEKAGKEDQCVEYLQKSLKLKPDFDEALNHLGYLWADKGLRLNEALTMIRGALRSEPDNPAYLDSLGWVLFKLGRHKEAVAPLQRAVKLLDAPDATVLDHLGDVLHALGRKSEAREAWVESEKLEKSDAVRRKIDTAH